MTKAVTPPAISGSPELTVLQLAPASMLLNTLRTNTSLTRHEAPMYTVRGSCGVITAAFMKQSRVPGASIQVAPPSVLLYIPPLLQQPPSPAYKLLGFFGSMARTCIAHARGPGVPKLTQLVPPSALLYIP